MEYVTARPGMPMPPKGPILAVESLGVDGDMQIVLCSTVNISREEANAAPEGGRLVRAVCRAQGSSHTSAASAWHGQDGFIAV